MVFFNTNQGGKNGIKQGLDLPDSDEFDEKINLRLTRKQTKETKELFKRKNTINSYQVLLPLSIFL